MTEFIQKKEGYTTFGLKINEKNELQELRKEIKKYCELEKKIQKQKKIIQKIMKKMKIKMMKIK